MTASQLVGKTAPLFRAKALFPDQSEGMLQLSSWQSKGKYIILFFYPMDFSIVCPTEITALHDRIEDFEDLDTEILGISTDSIYVHEAWTNTAREDNGIGNIAFPLISDSNHRISRDYGVLQESEGTAARAMFIISPEGTVMYSLVHHDNIGRDVEETLRVLEALQTGKPCPADWKPGTRTIE
ncbi:peroxiredoxin [Salibacterium halotolerans]|uniref:Alkyl hydroperoxide reductase subunit AhpC (Peroxiredoxin) n=1 Tax=Salibacterium halotolerans TaxID=1884432 RepID=A0A1I5LXN9_9BACI|nr:peroxiredoxin [Salibacterium halotolerans]SFP02002.1 Alkyl hydroperoxide reductase subunit AhpC (peroxiredoxin) [Salibacterium halotolerans]